ncbi:MAG: hypothetical protein ACRD2U_05430 [Terriglobales bacterium]
MPFHSWMPHNFLFLHSLLLVVLQNSDKQEDIYDILWAVVFGFATLNIVGLALRRFETSGNRLNLGEILAVMIVGLSIILLGWEMLYVLKILPFKLEPH